MRFHEMPATLGRFDGVGSSRSRNQLRVQLPVLEVEVREQRLPERAKRPPFAVASSPAFSASVAGSCRSVWANPTRVNAPALGRCLHDDASVGERIGLASPG
jgi:hypothetical protein